NASGGVPAYTFSLLTNLSGGSINPSTGLYTAGATSGVTDVVRVTDAANNTVNANVVVNAALAIVPASETVAAGSTVNFDVSGGVGTPTFSLVTNSSG